MAGPKIYLSRGDKVNLFSGGKESPMYRSIVEEVTEDGLIVMPLPTYKSIPLNAHRGDSLNLQFFRDNGKFTAPIFVRDLYLDNGIRTMVIEIAAEPEKEQNRDFYRLPIGLKATLYELPEGEIPAGFTMENALSVTSATTKDLSASGLRLQATGSFPAGTRFIIELFLNGDNEPPMYLGAKLVRSESDPITRYSYFGFQFLGDKVKQDIITKFVLKEQHKQIKWRRAMQD